MVGGEGSFVGGGDGVTVREKSGGFRAQLGLGPTSRDVARHAWKLKKENTELKQVLAKQRHEIACLEVALLVKKEDAMRMGEKMKAIQRENKLLLDENRSIKDELMFSNEQIRVLTSFSIGYNDNGEDDGHVVNDVEASSSFHDANESLSLNGAEGGDLVNSEDAEGSASATLSDAEDLDKPTNPHPVTSSTRPQRLRRASVGGHRDNMYTLPSLRTKLRQGDENTFSFGVQDPSNFTRRSGSRRRRSTAAKCND